MDRKDEILIGLVEARRRILDVVAKIPAVKQKEVFLGIWSIKDLLAHLVGWDYSNLEAVKDIQAGQPPRVFEHWDPDWVKYNAKLVEKYKRDNLVELLDALRQSQSILIEYVRTIPEEEIVKDFGIRSPNGTNITIEWFLQFEIEDEGRHLQQIQDWMNDAN